MYNILPETENRTLEDIELHFSDNSKKLTDRKIMKSKNSEGSTGKNQEKMDENDEDGRVNEGFSGDNWMK